MNSLRVQINPENSIFQEKKNGPFPKNLKEAIYFYNSVETFFIKISIVLVKYVEVKRKGDQ